MSFLGTVFGGKDRFLSLLEASASETRASVQDVKILLNTPSAGGPVDKILQHRKQEGQITEEIEECLCQGVKSSFDSEEIETLARALSRISSGVKKFATRYQVCAKHVQGSDLQRQQEMLEGAINAICQMVSELRHPRLAAAQAHHQELQKIEGEADKLFIASVMDLYHKRQDSLKGIMLRDLYELMENVIDRCRTAGNIMLRITLKHT